MNPLPATDLEAIFLAAAERTDPAARAALLDERCAGNAELRRRVEALLAAHDNPDSLLDRPIADPAEAPTRAAPDEPDRTHAYTGLTDEDEADALAFLAPSERPGALGRIGQYDVLEVLGKGGFGIVFRAFDDKLQRVVAVKVLAPSLATTSPARKRFLREARSSASVRHEHVVQVHAVEEQPLPHLVMEYIPGETLQRRMDKTGPLELPEVLGIGRQIAEGLAAAHEQGLVHRDIKPSNILASAGPNPTVKITDFGLARAADDASLTRSGVVAGTPMYMAPEQAKGESLDHRADLFSLGSVLYVMATGRPPFRASSTLAVLKRVAEDEPRPIREIIPETPEWLCRIVGKLHAKDAADRYQTAREVADVLRDCEEQVKAHGALRDYTRIPGGASPRPRQGRTAALVGAAAAIAVLVWLVAAFTPVRHWFGNPPADPNTGRLVVEVREPGRLRLEVFRTGDPESKAVFDNISAGVPFDRRVRVGNWNVVAYYEGVASPFHSKSDVGPEGKTVVVPAFEGPPPLVTAPDAWVQLFNGMDLTGWTPSNAEQWSVEGGVLVGRGPATLFTKLDDYSDFHLRAEVRVNDVARSGIWFRQNADGADRGYQAIINCDPMPGIGGPLIPVPGTGSLQVSRSAGEISNLTTVASPVPSDRWFTMEIIARGASLTVMVDGKTTTQVRNDAFARGRIGLELTGNQARAEYRKVEIKRLSASSPEKVEEPTIVLPRPLRSIVMNQWGTLVDPTAACKVETRVEQAAFTLPGDKTRILYPKSNMDAPRWLWNADGDFTYQVTVQGFPWPKKGTSAAGPNGNSYREAGFLVWVDENNFVRFGRAGLGESEDGKPYWHAEGFVAGERILDERDWVDGPLYHLQVERRGGSLILRRSIDGSRWTDWRTIDKLAMPPRVKVGLIALNNTTEAFHPVFENLAMGVYSTRESALKPPEVPKRTADILQFIRGTWKREGVVIMPKPAGDPRTYGQLTFDAVANGTVMRGLTVDVNGRENVLILHAYDAAKDRIRSWYFSIEGEASASNFGEYDPSSHTFLWLEKFPDGTQSLHKMIFVDANTVQATNFDTDADGNKIYESRATFTRTTDPPVVPKSIIDPKRPAEMKVLDQLVGDWRSEIAVALPGPPNKEVELARTRSCLAGHMIESYATNETTKGNDYSLNWYDAATKQYRLWAFIGGGQIHDLRGTWDDATKTLSLASSDGSVFGHTTFQGADRYDFRRAAKNPAGEIVFDANGMAARAAPESETVKALRLKVDATGRTAADAAARFKNGTVSGLELKAAELAHVDARLALAEERKDPAELARLTGEAAETMKALQDEYEKRVEAGILPKSTLDRIESQLADLKLRVAKLKDKAREAKSSALDDAERAKLLGIWTAKLSDERLPRAIRAMESLRIRFDETGFELLESDKPTGTIPGRFEVQAATKEILLHVPGAKVPVRCSYRIEDGRLTLDFAGLFGEALMIQDRAHSINNLKQIGLALHNYLAVHGSFPPAGSVDPKKTDAKFRLSWRVAILPYVEQGELFKQFKQDEPWDGPTNKPLVAKMPKIYLMPGIEAKKPGLTHYRAFTGPGTALEPKADGKGGPKLADFQDGTANTLMLVEAAEPIEWTRPDDMAYSAVGPLPKLGVGPDGANALFADGNVKTLAPKAGEKGLRAAITRSGKETDPLELISRPAQAAPPLKIEFERSIGKPKP